MSRSYGNFTGTPDMSAVQRAMQKKKESGMKPGGDPLVGEMPKVVSGAKGSVPRSIGGRSFESAPPSQVLSSEKRKKLKSNVGKQWGLKNAAARRLSKIGQSKFSGKAV